MTAATFLSTLNDRATEAGGLTLDVLAAHVADAFAEISGEEDDPLEGMLKDDLVALAEERGVEVTGTGVDGAVLKSDLVKALR